MESRRNTLLGAGTAVGTVLVILPAVDVLFRVVDFGYQLRVHIIESTAPEAGEVGNEYLIDPCLVWVDKGYDGRLNDAKTRPVDVAFREDSCTKFGNCDQLLAALVEENTGIAASAVKFGVVRQVDPTQEVVVCDLAAAFESFGEGGGRDACFNADGIRFCREGNARAARFLSSASRTTNPYARCFVDTKPLCIGAAFCDTIFPRHVSGLMLRNHM